MPFANMETSACCDWLTTSDPNGMECFRSEINCFSGLVHSVYHIDKDKTLRETVYR